MLYNLRLQGLTVKLYLLKNKYCIQDAKNEKHFALHKNWNCNNEAQRQTNNRRIIVDYFKSTTEI